MPIKFLTNCPVTPVHQRYQTVVWQSMVVCCVAAIGLSCWLGCTRDLPSSSRPNAEASASAGGQTATVETAASAPSANADASPSGQLPPAQAAAVGDTAVGDTAVEDTAVEDTAMGAMGAAGTQHLTQPAAGWTPRGAWTTQRVIVLAEHGPWLIDLSFSVGEQSLDQASQVQLTQVADELLAKLEPPATWVDLLELPLVRSGWLGNLVPAEEQREQLISLYDTQRDGIVAENELPAFLSRGLARVKPLKLNDVGYASDHDPSQSPWGKADRNRDFALDNDERMEFAAAIEQQDLNGDGVLTRRELAGSGGRLPQNMAGNRRSSLLQTTTLLLAESWTTSPEQDTAAHDSPVKTSPVKTSLEQNSLAQPPTVAMESKQLRKLASDVLRHYTFLSHLSREQWPDWSDQRWLLIDRDASQQVDQGELQQWLVGPPQAQLYFALPHSHQPAIELTPHLEPIHVQLLDPTLTWQASSSGGQLVGSSCALRVELSDAFSGPGKMQLRQQLQQALGNPQLQAFLVQRLELEATAFELLDEDQDAALSDAEFERVWRWLSSRQGARLAGRWMLSTHPWFQLADHNADGRLAELELQTFSQSLADLDRNGDSLVTPNELPLVAKLEISRTDSRLDARFPGGSPPPSAAGDSDWFSAMDTNRDASISASEFLGETTEFLRMDANQDGFLSRGEVYFPKTSK